MATKVGIFLPKRQNGDDNLPYIKRQGKLPNEVIDELLALITSNGEFSLLEVDDLNNTLILNGDIFYNDINLNELDIFFWYGEIRKPNSICGRSNLYVLELLQTLSRKVKVIPNPYLFEVGLDKYTSHITLKQKGVKVPDFILLTNSNFHLAKPILDEWGYALLKPRKGAFGKGVTLIDDFSRLRDLLEFMEEEEGINLDKGILLEKYYENHPQDWISTTIINGEIMYGYRKRLSRFADLGDSFKSGSFQKVYDSNEVGGEVDLCDLTPKHQELALSAYHAMGYEIIGFDMIWHQDRPIIVDENTFPGLYPNLFKLKNLSLAELMYRLIAQAETSPQDK